MRRLGQHLGVEAMSLYNHVSNKDDLLDGIVDLAWTEIAETPDGAGWKKSIRHRSISAHVDGEPAGWVAVEPRTAYPSESYWAEAAAHQAHPVDRPGRAGCHADRLRSGA